MGTECFNGNNKDLDLTMNSTRAKKGNSQMKLNCLENNSYQYKYNEPIHYQTHYYTSQIQQNYYNKKNEQNIKISKNSRANSFQMVNSGKQKKIHNFTKEELEDQVNDILRIRIPFFDNSVLKTLSAFTFLSGNGPYHEGLMFFTTNKNFYIAQSYPITFVRVYDYYKGIAQIISFNNLNNKSKKYTISEIHCPQEPITLYDVLNIINSLPNKYNLLNDNCQNFCNNILEALYRKFKIEMETKPNRTKINFLKMQKKIINNIQYFSNSGRFSNS